MSFLCVNTTGVQSNASTPLFTIHKDIEEEGLRRTGPTRSLSRSSKTGGDVGAARERTVSEGSLHSKSRSRGNSKVTISSQVSSKGGGASSRSGSESSVFSVIRGSDSTRQRDGSTASAVSEGDL